MEAKRGAPKGNQDARRHSFYSQVMEEAEACLMEEAGDCDLGDEIAIMRIKIRRLLETQPDNIQLQMQAIDMLAKLLKARYQLSAEQKSSMKDASAF